MRIDFQEHEAIASAVCWAFSIVDEDTGQAIGVPVWYADEETGECRAYRQVPARDKGSVFYIDPATKRPVSYTFFRRIKFVPVPGRETEAEGLRSLLGPNPALTHGAYI